MNTRASWDVHFMQRAFANATMSTCLTRHVGAVATRQNRSFADGFNGNLPGQKHCDEGGCQRCRDSKKSGADLGRCLCVHAEQNLVAYCAATGTPLADSTIYSTTKPCLDCLKLLISAGVLEVVYHYDYPESNWLPAPSASRPFTMREFKLVLLD